MNTFDFDTVCSIKIYRMRISKTVRDGIEPDKNNERVCRVYKLGPSLLYDVFLAYFQWDQKINVIAK